MNNTFVVVVTYNAQDFIERCIKSLKKAIPLYQVVIVDNDSKDKTVEAVKEYKEVVLIHAGGNLGYSAGNNLGIKYALKKGAKYIFILNPDTEIFNDTIINLQHTAEQYPQAGIISPLMINQHGKVWSMGGDIDKNRYTAGLRYNGRDLNEVKEKMYEVNFLSGTALFIKSDVFKKVGFLREDYFLYYEDVDFCIRTQRAGYRLIADSNSKIFHYESSTVGKNSPIMQYYLARNHLYIVERFAPLKVKLRELLRIPKTIYQARRKRYELKGIKDYFLRKLGDKKITS